MKIGNWQVKECLAGSFRLDGGAMFGVVPKTLWSKLIPADGKNTIPMALRTMLIKGHDGVFLVDSGSGRGYGEKLAKIYGFSDEDGLEKAFEELDITYSDVTDVIVTHLHFDHGGGLVKPSGGSWELVFPNARHHVQRAQWEHALSPTPRDRASFFVDRIELLQSSGVLEVHENNWSPAEGIEIVIVHGHTPGQQLVRVYDSTNSIFYCGDLIPTSAHIPVPYIMAYDLDPVKSMQEKEYYLKKAVHGGWILFFEHDPEVTACYVKNEKGRYIAADEVII